MSRYTYQLIVEQHADGSATAYIDGPDSPLRGHGDSPLQAVRALCETIREWPISGADQWLSTPTGVDLTRQFVPGFNPGKAQGKS